MLYLIFFEKAWFLIKVFAKLFSKSGKRGGFLMADGSLIFDTKIDTSGFEQSMSTLATLAQTKMNDVMSNISSSLVQGLDFSGVFSGVSDVISSEIQRVFSQSRPMMISAGGDMMTSVKDGISRNTSEVTSACDAVTSAMLSTFSQPGWAGIGSGVISGIIGGMYGMMGALNAAAQNIARQTVDSFKSAFAINSPSVEMQNKIGRYLLPGMMAGMDKTMPQTEKYVKNQMQTLVSGMQSAVNKTQTPARTTGWESQTPKQTSTAQYTTNMYQTINTQSTLSPAQASRYAEDMLKRTTWQIP